MGVICYNRWILSEGHEKYFKDRCVLNSQPTFSIFKLFKLNELWPYDQEHVNQIILNHNSLKLSVTNIWGLHSNFVDCESFFEWNSPNILALCETNLDDSIDSGNFFMRSYLKDSSTHINGLAVYVKERLPFAQDLSLENSADSYLSFWLALLHSVSYFFSVYQSPSLSLCTIFDSISSNIGEIISINPSANILSFETSTSVIRTVLPSLDWLTYSGGTDRPGELL